MPLVAVGTQLPTCPAASVQGSYLSLGMARTPEQWVWAGTLLGGGAALAGAYYLYTVTTSASKRKQYNRAFDEVSKYQ